MTVEVGKMDCDIYKSAFSGEVVFAIETDQGLYEGVAPVRYAQYSGELSAEQPQKGSLSVRVISNGGQQAKVATPDGEVISVPATAVHY